ncbi:MAG: M56 family metallopeptidase [Gemmatimonadota bacterium]|jgi:hypothetical protein
MLAWMVYTWLVSSLVAVGALAAEKGSSALRLPVRFIWALALTGMVVFAGLGPLRAGASGAVMPSSLAAGQTAVEAPARGAGAGAWGLSSALEGLRSVLGWPVRAAGAIGSGPVVDGVLGAVWAALVAGGLLLGLATLFRYRAARRSWPRRHVSGLPVRVAPAAGPAVLGLVRPEIVVPSWLLSRPEAEQRMIVLHEREHVRARDGWTLALGWLAVSLLPWNPAAWWVWRRLRTAVEVDCDARVLRHGVARRDYGTILIDLAGRGSGLSLGVPALAGSRPTLERRLIAMTASFRNGNPIRATAFGALAALALVAACESEMPTAAEVEQLDATTAEATARKLALIDAAEEDVTYSVDGRVVSAKEARSLAPGDLTRLEVVREDGAGRAEIRLRTLAGEADRAPELDSTREPQQVKLRVAAGTGSFDGLLIIDGEEAESSRMGELRPAEIESIEVIKGAAAAELSDDPRAARGIIRVTTKTGAGTR